MRILQPVVEEERRALDRTEVERFLYYEQPTNFTAIEPTGGPTGGGTLVTITGGPFDRYSSVASDVLCRFGENYTRVTRLQSGRIECASPARASRCAGAASARRSTARAGRLPRRAAALTSG